MPLLPSDNAKNKEVIKALFYNEDGRPIDEKAETIINNAKDAYYEVIGILEGPSGRIKVLEAVKERRNELAIWKAIVTPGEWQSFMTDLQLHRVPRETKDSIKGLINADFEEELAYALETMPSKVIVYTGVKSCVTRNSRDGIIVEIELMNEE